MALYNAIFGYDASALFGRIAYRLIIVYSKGIMGRMEFEQSKSNQRMEKLAGFQIKILRSALTKYPEAKRVVYSTCSVFPEENEDVVRQVLETNNTFKLVPAMKFVNGIWKNFGSAEYGNLGSYCLYAKQSEDFTNGFFVAVFERLEEGEENEFFNTKIYNFKKHVQNQEKRKMRQQQSGDYGNSSYTESNQSHENYDNNDIEKQGNSELKKNTNVIGEKNDYLQSSSSGKKRKNRKTNDVKVEDNIEEVIDGDTDNQKRKKKKNRDLSVDTSDISQKKIKKEQHFLESGNTDCILKDERDEDDDSLRKKKKEKRYDIPGQSLGTDNGDTKLEIEELETLDDSRVSRKKKKKRKHDTGDQAFEVDNVTNDVIKAEEDGIEMVNEDINGEGKKKKKIKHDTVDQAFEVENIINDVIKAEEGGIEMVNEDINGEGKKKKKKRKHDTVNQAFEVENIINVVIKAEEGGIEMGNENINGEGKTKKKKRKKHETVDQDFEMDNVTNDVIKTEEGGTEMGKKQNRKKDLLLTEDAVKNNDECVIKEESKKSKRKQKLLSVT